MKKLRLSAKVSPFAKTPVKIQNETPDVAVKRIILEIAGDYSTDPASLRESLQLKENLLFGDNEYSLLQIRLNDFVKSKKQSLSVSTSEASGCGKVGDCVSLVEGKLSSPGL